MSLEPYINGAQEKPYFCSHDHKDVSVDAYVTIINLIILNHFMFSLLLFFDFIHVVTIYYVFYANTYWHTCTWLERSSTHMYRSSYVHVYTSTGVPV